MVDGPGTVSAAKRQRREQGAKARVRRLEAKERRVAEYMSRIDTQWQIGVARAVAAFMQRLSDDLYDMGRGP